jgi:hypothetical protein
MIRIGRAGRGVAGLVAIVLAGCGADHTAGAGSPETDRPSRAYDSDVCISDTRHLELGDFQQIDCAQALEVLEAYDAKVDDTCTLTQLRNGDCEVSGTSGASYGTWKVKSDGATHFDWSGADSSNSGKAFAAKPTQHSNCRANDGKQTAEITDLKEVTCHEVQQVWENYQPLVLKCTPEDLEEVTCRVPDRSKNPADRWAVGDIGGGDGSLYLWEGAGLNTFDKQFTAKLQ